MSTPWLTADPVDDGEKKKEQEELLVFGYACKLFPYDEKATLIEAERHLIPWMGDENVMIDRYDGRGHLYDLSAYDAEKKKFDTLSEDEKHIEAMCDQERYLELHTDVQEQALYEEEEWKRYYQSLSEGFNAVGFVYEQQYDPSLPTDDDQELTAALEAAVEKFVAPSELLVPPEMSIPDSNKINAIVEKTANFVVLQGGQMEIMIKTKQSNNPLFEFLNIDNKLYPYYKHMIKMIKSGKYKPKVENDSEENDDDDDDDDNDGCYLHPILTVKSQPAECRKPVKLPVVDVQNTSYGDLIRSVRASTARQNANKLKARELEESEAKSSIPPFMAQPVYSPNVPPPPGVEPVTLPPSHQPSPPGTDNAIPLCLPKYDSCDSPENTAGSDYGCQSDIIPPAPDVQPVIDKMALYVAKNGIEFEMVVKNKCDPRFEFLNKDHLHHPYYEFKKQLHLKEFEKERKKLEEQKSAQNKGVSFSIKTKTKEQESVPLEKRPVFACESSEDETEGEVHKQPRSNSPDTDVVEVQLKKSTEIKTVSDDKLEKTDSPSQEDTDRKLAEEKLKDRLALAAREKLAQATKEKQLQAERKRKAALFINMLKSSNQLVPQGNNSENSEGGDHLEMSSSGNTPLPSQTSSPQLDNNYECTNSSDYPLESASKKETAKSSSEKANEKNDQQHQSGSHSKSHHRHSRSPTPPCAYHLSRSRYNSTVVLPHGNEKSPSQSREKRSRSPHNKKVGKSPSRKRSSSKSPSRKGKSSMTKSPSPSKRKHQSQSRSQSRSPNRYVSSARQSRRRDWSPNYASSHNRSSKLRHRSRSRSPSHPSRSQHTSSSIGGSQSHRREKSRSRSQSRTHRDRSKSPHSKKNNKSPSRKRSHSKSPLRKLKSYSKSPNSKKKHKRSRSRSQSKKRCKSSRLESEKSSSKSTSKSKSRKDSKDKKSHLSSKSVKKENSSKKKNGDAMEKKRELSKNGGPTIDLTTKPDSTIELSSEAENDVNSSILPNDQQSEEMIETKVESQVSETILSKVRAMLKASRQAILTEKDCPDI